MSERGGGFDFDAGSADKGDALERRSRWRVDGKVPTEHFVHRHELGEVDHVDRDFDDLVEGRSGGLQDGFEILADLTSFGDDAAGGELAGGDLETELARGEDPVADLDRLGPRRGTFGV